jgi:hypothetical protein
VRRGAREQGGRAAAAVLHAARGQARRHSLRCVVSAAALGVACSVWCVGPQTWVTKRLLDIDNVRILVFDEADEMLKADGFADDSVSYCGAGSGRRGVTSRTPSNPQTC